MQLKLERFSCRCLEPKAWASVEIHLSQRFGWRARNTVAGLDLMPNLMLIRFPGVPYRFAGLRPVAPVATPGGAG
jgi:hypothetical protein